MLQKLGRYEIIEELGRGAMGVIYKAKDPAIGRFVAIKTIRLGDFTDPSHLEELRSRLKREAQSAGALSHPNIITVFDVGEEEGLSYFAMELVEGATLETLIETHQKLEEAAIVHIARQTADALGFAHQHGIVHRDIKPANIMLTQDGRVKVADFGIAKVGSTRMTQTGMLLGSPSYMAPEHFLGQGLDGRSDIFALGIVLYELITGQPPFVAENLGALSYKIVHEDAIPPIRLKPDLNPQLNEIIVKALARDPAQRFQSAQELCAALDAIPAGQLAGSKSSPAVVKGISAPAITSVKDYPLVQTVAVASPPEPKRSRLRPLLLLLLLAITSAAAAFLYPDELQETLELARQEVEQWLKPAEQSKIPELPESKAPVPGTQPEPPPTSPSDTSQASHGQAADPGSAAISMVDQSPPAVKPPTQIPSRTEESPPASLAKTPPAPEVGAIEVSSTPPGAEIVFDDQSQADWLTPHAFQNVRKGRHTLEVRKTGYLPERRIVILLGNETQRINVTLTLAAGILKVSTVPSGAQIFVDGELKTELTPASLRIPAGARRILLRKAGYRDVEQVIEIEDNSITTLNQQLAQLPQ